MTSTPQYPHPSRPAAAPTHRMGPHSYSPAPPQSYLPPAGPRSRPSGPLPTQFSGPQPTHTPAPLPTTYPDAPVDDGVRDRDPVPWAVLAAASVIAVGAGLASAFGLLGTVAELLLVAAGLVLAVVPMGPLVRRGDRAVSRGVAVVLCLAVALGGVAIGYGARGATTPVADTPPVPAPAAPAAPADPAAPGEPAVAQPVALTDPNRTDLLVDRDGSMGVAQTSTAVGDRELTDALRTYCSCEPGDVHDAGLTVALGGGYARLDAVLGTDRSSPGTGQLHVTMRDEATGRVLLDQAVDFTAATPVSVDVTGVQRLDIVVRGPLGDVVGVIGEPLVTA